MAVTFAVAVVGIYKLNPLCGIPILLGSCLAVRRICTYGRADKEHEWVYTQVTSYLEQLLCSYRRLGHAGKALADCRLLFEESQLMGRVIRQAEHILFTGEGVLDGNILEAAFSVIEGAFDSRRMRIIHRFILNGERTGSDCGASADILLEDLELWKNRTKMYETRKRFIKAECGIATIMALLLCYVSRLLTPEELGFDISESSLYQLSTTTVVLLFLLIIVTVCRKLSGSWLDQTSRLKESESRQYEKLYYVLKSQTNRKDFVTRHMAKKILSRYVQAEFPYWLLLVTLYLQSESTYQAMRCSLSETDSVFRQELEKMIEEIYDSPRSLEPYLGFFSELALTEVQSGMKILYSVNTNGYEDSARQLSFLIAQNNRLMDKNESYHHSNRMAGMSLLKQLPMLVSCLKLLIDLVNLLALTMGSFQNMI